MNLHTYYQGPFLSRVDKSKAISYPASGALTSLSDYLTFGFFFSILNSGLLWATVGAYIVGLVVSYMLNRFWVFRDKAGQQGEATNMWRYLAFLGANLAITYAMLWAFENWFGISPYIGKILVGFFMFFWVYIGDSYFVFKGTRTGPIQI